MNIEHITYIIAALLSSLMIIAPMNKTNMTRAVENTIDNIDFENISDDDYKLISEQTGQGVDELKTTAREINKEIENENKTIEASKSMSNDLINNMDIFYKEIG